MKTKGKGKSKRDKAESKAIIGIVLAAIMLASVFAGISASAVADNNTANESVDDSGNIEVAVGNPAIGEITYEKGLNTPTGNIGNTTADGVNQEILQIKFTAAVEDIDINNITVQQIGNVNQTNFTNVSVWTASEGGVRDTLVGWNNVTTTNNADILIEFTQNAPIVVPEGESKYVLVCVNYTDFTMGTCFQMNMTKFNATGNLSKATITTKNVGTEGLPLSNVRCGTGTLTVSKGANDVVNKTMVDAGKNEAGIVIMQANFTAATENCNLTNITLEWNGSADATIKPDINTIYLVNDTNATGVADGALNWSHDTIVTEKGNFTSSVKLEFPTAQTVEIGKNRTFLIVVNTTKTFWAGETLAVNITDFNATGVDSGYIVSKKDVPLASNHTIGQAKIKVELGWPTAADIFIPLETQVNVETLQLNFTATAGKVNITNITLQANKAIMPDDVSNATYPKIWQDVNGNGRVDCDDLPLNTTAAFNVSEQEYPFGVNFDLTATNLTVGGNETEFGVLGYNSKKLIIAVNCTANLVFGDRILLVINRTDGRYNYSAIDTRNNKLINDTSTSFDASIKKVVTSDTFIGNPLFIEKGAKSPSVSVSAGEYTNVGVLQLNFTNRDTDDDMKVLYITVNENGTADATTDITNVTIVRDTDADGSKGTGESILDSKSFGTDNANVTFTISGADSVIPAGGSTHYLVLVNTSTSFTIGKTLKFNVLDPSTDCVVTDNAGGTFEITNHSEVAIVGHERTAAGTIEASFTEKPEAGNVSASVNMSCTCLPLMQLNFTAGTTEPVNVTNITITWNGTASNTSIMKIMVINDTNVNARYDPDDDIVLNDTAVFANNRSLIDLTPNNLTVNNVTGKNVATMLICAYTNKSNLSHGETLAINISERSTQYNASGTVTGLTLKDLNSGELASYVQTAKDSGKLLIDAADIPADTIIKGNKNDVVLMNLTFARVGEYINVTSIRIRANSTFNEFNNSNVTGVALRMDGQIISGRENFTKDNGTVFLEASPAIYITDNKTVEIVANISSSVTAGSEIVLRLEDPARDVSAIGLSSEAKIQNETTTAIYSPQNVTVTGSVDVAYGSPNNTAAGPITAMGTVDQNNTAILQLNFSASYEPINITGINVTWLGDLNATCNITVVAYNDTNGDGIRDAGDIALGGEKCFNAGKTADVSFTTKLTVPKGDSTDMLICLNVTAGYTFTPGEKLQINVTNYTARGVTSDKTITHGTPMVSEILTGTGNITVVDTNIPVDKNITACANTTVPVWQLNMSTNHENATLENITLTFNGTDPADIAKVDLYNDTNADGAVDPVNDTLIATNVTAIGADMRVTLVPTSTIYINKTPVVKSFLVTVNTSSSFKDNDTIAFNITKNTTAPKMEAPDVKAKGVVSGIVMATNYTVPLSSNVTTGYCCIDLYEGAGQPSTTDQITGNVSVMALNFSTKCCGKVNITNITVTWNGTANTARLDNISIWKDNGDETFSESSDTLINITTFGNKTIETLTAGGAAANLTVDGVTNNVYIVVKIGTALTAGKTLGFNVNQTRGVGYNATCNKTGQVPNSTKKQTITGQISVTGYVSPVGELNLTANRWNLVSVPNELNETNDQAGELFGLVAGERVWYYNRSNCSASVWEPQADQANYTIEPGYGYWVYKLSDLSKTPVYKTYGAGETPPVISIPLCVDWNMIGHMDTESTYVTTALTNLIRTDGYAKYSKVLAYNVSGWQTCSCDEYGDPRAGADFTDLEPYKGYWILMKESGTYA